MAEIHVATAAEVDRAVFPLTRSVVVSARLDRSPALFGRRQWEEMV